MTLTPHERAARMAVGTGPAAERAWRRFAPPEFLGIATAEVPDAVTAWAAEAAEALAAPRCPAARNLVLWGPPGTAKTAVAFAAAHTLVRAGALVRRFQHDQLMSGLMAFAAHDEAGIPPSVVEGVDCLVVEDLGAAPVTEARSARLSRIVDARWEWWLPTVWTSNLDPRDFAAHLDDRGADRVLSSAMVLHLDGPSLRWRPLAPAELGPPEGLGLPAPPGPEEAARARALAAQARGRLRAGR